MFILVEAARRFESAAREVLALVGDGSASCAELREALPVLRSASAAISAAQTEAAATIAVRERHGDDGAEVLAASAGMSRREAQGQVRTAATLRKAPVLREAVESGRVPQANARQLAAAVEKVGARAVESDGGLLDAAASMRPEQFTREARRWTTERDGDDGAGEHARQRARRRLRVWDGDDGMVHLHGEFDKVAGNRIANRLRRQARRLLDDDKKTPSAKRRSFDQCMADALDNATHRAASRCDDTNTGDDDAAGSGTTGSDGCCDTNTAGSGRAGSGGEGRHYADICVMVRADDDTGRLVAELPDRTRLPRSVLDALSCDAAITAVICDRQGSPIWRSYASRGATETQKQILFAAYGGCFQCGANPGLCQIHHIEPVWLGGRTEINNLVPLCWSCHSLIHEHGWWILKRTLGHHTMHPPDSARHGPAHQPDQPVQYRTAPRADRGRNALPPGDAVSGPAHSPARDGPPHDGGPRPDDNHSRELALF